MTRPLRSALTTAARLGVVWVVTLAVLVTAVTPPERCATPAPDRLETAIDAATGWLLVNQEPDGTWLYDYDRSAAAPVPDYNLVRHAGVTMALYMRDALQGDPAAFAAAERGLSWLDGRLVAVGGGVAYADGTRAETGTAALALAGLIWRRDATGSTDRDPLIAGLADFVAGQVFERGAVSVAHDLAADRRVDAVSKFFTGEAMWALALADHRLPGHGWGEVALRIADHVALHRDDEEPEFPPNDDHWSAYALAELAGGGAAAPVLAAHHLAYADRLAGLWSAEARFDAQRTGRGLNRWTRGAVDRGGQQGTNLEGLAALWRLAVADPRQAGTRSDLAQRVACVADILIDAQVDPVEATAYAEPSRVVGAWFTADRTRMDTQQHALAGLLGAWRTLQVDDPTTVSGTSTASTPAAAAAVAVLVASLVWAAVAGTRARGVAGGPGGALSGAALSAAPLVALAGPSLLAAADVSATTGRLAVAAVVAGALVGRAVRAGTGRPPPGMVALLAPPVLVTAAVAGADLGALPAAIAVLAGSAVGTVGARVDPSSPGGRAAATLTLTSALAGSVAALVSGVVGL